MLIGWTIVYCSLVITPAVMCYIVFTSAAATRFNSRLDDVRRDLAVRGDRLVARCEREKVVVGLVEGLNRRGIAGFLARAQTWQRHHPGAMRWIAWDRTGTLLKMPDELSVNGKRAWQEVVRKIWHPDAGSRTTVAERAQVVAGLQRFLGRRPVAGTLVESPRRLISTVILDRPCWFVWAHHRPAPHTQPAPVGDPLGGILLQVFPEKLPAQFWIDPVLRLAARDHADRQPPFVMFDLCEPWRNVVSPSLARLSQGFVPTLRRRFLERSSELIQVGSYIAVPVSLDAAGDTPQRLLVLADIADLYLERATAERRSGHLLLLFLVATAAGGAYWGRSGGHGVSLRLRVVLLFGAAVLLPTLGLVVGGAQLVRWEDHSERAVAIDMLQQSALRLNARGYMYFEEYGERVRERLVARITGLTREQDLLAALRTAMRQGLGSSFFVSRLDGGLWTSGGRRLASGPLEMLRFAMRREHNEDVNLLAQSVVSPPGQKADVPWVPLTATAGAVVSRINAVRMLRLGDAEYAVLKMAVTINFRTRLVIVVFDPHDLELDLAARASLSMRRRELRSPTALAPRVHFVAATPIGGCSWLNASLGRQPAVARAVALENETVGLIDWAGETQLFFVPARETRAVLRPIWLLPDRGIRARMERRWQLIVRTAALTSVGAIALALALAAGVLGPVRRLDQAVAAVRAGDLHSRVDGVTRDEMGILAMAFNDMVGRLRERERMKAYVSATVLAAVRDDTVSRGASARSARVTVLFSHIAAFSQIARTWTPEAVFSMLNSYFAGVEPVVREQGGDIDKFIGDAVMARFFGDGQERQAVNAALAMRRHLNTYNVSRQQAGLPAINIGIGINTGEVMLGDVGSRNRKDLTVIGDAVNLAARLEVVAHQGTHTRIVVSAETAGQLEPSLRLVELAVTTVKGKDRPVQVFEVVGPTDAQVPQ